MNEMRDKHPIIFPIVLFLVICVLSLPSFFDTYRIMVFNVIPRDDYAPFLLCFTSSHGVWPTSPTGYRVLSMLPAVPFYWLLPVYRFSLLPRIDISYLRATQALAFLSLVSTSGAATIAFECVRKRLGGGMTEASLAAALTLVLMGYTATFGIEPLAAFVIFALLYVFELPVLFSIMIMPSAFINEKVPFFFLFLLASRSIFVPGFTASHKGQVAGAAIALVLYLMALIIIRLPGHEYQTTVSHWIPNMLEMVVVSFTSLKGLQLNMLPVVVVTIPCILFACYSRRSVPILAPSDFLVPLGLFAVALAGTVGFTVGRVAALALPLAVLSCTVLISECDERRRSNDWPLSGTGRRTRRTRDAET